MPPRPWHDSRRRGAAHDLSFTANTGMNVVACGDCHLLNFGAFATLERRLSAQRYRLADVAMQVARTRRLDARSDV